MKKLSWVFLALGLLLLAGCSANNQKSKQAERQLQQTIQKNKIAWNKQKHAAVNINHKNYDRYVTQVPSGYQDDDMSLNRFKNGSQLVVQAQVVNLQPEMGRLVTETKATIHIQKVISGDKDYQNKTVKTEFSGGLSKAKDYFHSIEGEYVGADYGIKDPKTIVYTTEPNIPMPKIGQTIIIGLNRFKPENKAQRVMYQKHGLTTKNFYVIDNPEVTYWVKRNGEFKLNNPAFVKADNKGKYPNLHKVTKKLNDLY